MPKVHDPARHLDDLVRCGRKVVVVDGTLCDPRNLRSHRAGRLKPASSVELSCQEKALSIDDAEAQLLAVLRNDHLVTEHFLLSEKLDQPERPDSHALSPAGPRVAAL